MNKFDKIDQLRIQGKTWEEIKDMGYNDNDRKSYMGYKFARENVEDIDTTLALEHIKIKKVKKELSIERQLLNEEIKYLTEYKILQDSKKKDIDFKYDIGEYTANHYTQRFHIITLSDFHYNGDNEQLLTLRNVRDNILDFIREEGVTELFIAELGDVVEGATLRTSQLMAIKKGLVEQTREVAKAYRLMLEDIIEKSNITINYIGIDSSNHTQLRNLGSKQNQLPKEDMMLVFNDEVERAKGIGNVYRADELVLDIYGYTFYIAHGHTVRNKEAHLEKVGHRLNKIIDFGFFGHYHHAREYDLYKRNSNGREYDMKVFYVPSLSKHHTQFEKDLNVTSCAGFGIYTFDLYHGNIGSRKVVV